jgi:hypothetical protein
MGPPGPQPQFSSDLALNDPYDVDLHGVLFAAPELPEDTLLEREHNETLARYSTHTPSHRQ